MPARRAVPLGMLLAALLWTADPPAIRRQGVVNAASLRPDAVGGAISRGSRIAIYGVRFADSRQTNHVLLTSAGHALPLTVLAAHPQLLEAWIPPDAPLGPARLTVTANGLTSPPEPVVIREQAPGLFSANGEGWGPARSSNQPGNSIAPGGRLRLAATGVSPGAKVEVRVGNSLARGLAIRPAGAPDYTAAITLEIPADAPEGCYVPVYARVAGTSPSNVVTVAIHRGGGACVSAPEDLASGWNGGPSAILLLSRTVRRTLDAPQERTEDEVNAAFLDVPAGEARSTPLLLLPPRGTCTTWAGALRPGAAVGDSVWSMLFGSLPGSGLDAGKTLAVHSSTLQQRFGTLASAPGVYWKSLSGMPGRAPARNRLSLDSGRLGIAGPGGTKVGPFAVALAVPEAFAMARRPPDPIDRSQPLTVAWTSAAALESLAIVLVGTDAERNVSGLAYCNAPPAAGTFTIPAELLSQAPAGRAHLILASWRGQTFHPPPTGIARMDGISVFARWWEVQVQ